LKIKIKFNETLIFGEGISSKGEQGGKDLIRWPKGNTGFYIWSKRLRVYGE
jgi:hypothetical protein